MLAMNLENYSEGSETRKHFPHHSQISTYAFLICNYLNNLLGSIVFIGGLQKKYLILGLQ
jgi:hypothetical protein